MGPLTEAFPPTMRIGLMADSHGSIRTLRQAIRALRAKGVDQLYHLGDFCDSVYQDHLSDIFNILETDGIRTVMGNNDFQIQSMLTDGYSDENETDTRRWQRFLKQTPLIRKINGICLAHSLPYDTIRSFYEPVDDGTGERALSIFSNTAYSIVFCGHSHAPILFRYRNNRVSREALGSRRTVSLAPQERYIIIVGSTLNGDCGIYDSKRNCYERICI